MYNIFLLNRSEYVEMKAKEKYADQSFEHKDIAHGGMAYVEYEGAGDMKPEAVKDLIKDKLGVTVVHVYQKRKEDQGKGVAQLDNIWVEDFLSKLDDDNKLGDLTFKAADGK